MKLIYKPFGLIAGVLAGMLAGAIFKRIWTRGGDEADEPDAKDKDRSWAEVVSAAAVKGAVFGGVKAAVDRAAASEFEWATGVWPGRTDSRAKRRR